MYGTALLGCTSNTYRSMNCKVSGQQQLEWMGGKDECSMLSCCRVSKDNSCLKILTRAVITLDQHFPQLKFIGNYLDIYRTSFFGAFLNFVGLV